MKQSMPGGQAIRTSSDQNQGKHGKSTVAEGFTTAHRRQRVAVRYLGRSLLGSPLGSSSQPWSVTTRTSCQPAVSSALDPLDEVRDQLRDAAGQTTPLVVAGLCPGCRTRSRPGPSGCRRRSRRRT